MSSSSSTEVGARLVESLRSIRDRNRPGYEELVETVGQMRVALKVGEEALFVSFRGGEFWVRLGTSGDADAHVVTDRGTIEDLLKGRTDLDEAILDGRLIVRAPIDDLIRLHDGLQAYVRAAVTTPRHQTGLFA